MIPKTQKLLHDCFRRQNGEQNHQPDKPMRAIKINLRTIMVFMLIVVSSLVVKNGLLNLLALMVLWLGIRLLWWPQFSPVFVFVFSYSWVQASIRVFHANFLNVEINQIPVEGGNIYSAAALTLAGLAMLAIGMRFGLRSVNKFQHNELISELESRPPLFWFYCYAAALAIAPILQAFAFVIQGLSQPLIALANMKWSFFWLFTHVALSRGGFILWLWIFVFLLEFLLGIGGFFSSFKTVIFFTIMGVLSSGARLNGWRFPVLATLGAMLITFGVAWTAIKGEQRSFLNQGQASQVVVVSFQDGIENIYKLMHNLNASDMSDAFMELIDRIAYIELFGEVLEVVPSQLPYENGALWVDAIARPFMPRLLFSQKSIIDESTRTNEYTGRKFLGIDQGTQVSLGYIADSYIDFGPWLMMAPIFAVGWFMGRFYSWIVSLPWCRGAMGAGFGTATAFQIASIEISNTKLFGGLIVSMLISWLVARWIVPMFYTSAKPSLRRTSLRRG